MPVVSAIGLHAEAEPLLPVHRLQRVGVRLLGPETHDDGVEWRERDGIDADQLAVDVKLEIVVADDIAGDHLAVRIDLDDRHTLRLDVGNFCRRDLVASVEKVRELRTGLIGRLSRHRQHRPVIGRYRADRAGPIISERNATLEKVLVHCLGQTLRDHSSTPGPEAGFAVEQHLIVEVLETEK